ncbi:MAG: acyltransferase [Bacteroidetes bacterium]|nr:acyltransferase [Bacteroidota bacterium]
MLKQLAKSLFRINGWTYENKIGPFGPKCILLAAPHTSNWDYIYGLVFFDKMGIEAKIAMKKDWFRFPFKQIIEPIGGIAVNRTQNGNDTEKKSSVDAMAELFNTHEELILVITPEGTRSKAPRWRTGFYHIAMKANVPLVLSYLDYENKKGVVGKIIYPTGNIESDLKEIMEFYDAHGRGKFHDQFSLDDRFL